MYFQVNLHGYQEMIIEQAGAMGELYFTLAPSALTRLGLTYACAIFRLSSGNLASGCIQVHKYRHCSGPWVDWLASPIRWKTDWYIAYS